MSARPQRARPELDQPIPFVKAWPRHVRTLLARRGRRSMSLGAISLVEFLASAADVYGESWWGVERLAEIHGRTPATVRRWRAELVELGWVDVLYGGGHAVGGAGATNLYKLRVDPAARVETTARERRIEAARGRRGRRPTRATSRGQSPVLPARRRASYPRDVARRYPRDVARRSTHLRREVQREVATECGACGKSRELMPGEPWCPTCSNAIRLRAQRLGESEPC